MHPRTCDYASVCVLPVADALALVDAPYRSRFSFFSPFSRKKQKSCNLNPAARKRAELPPIAQKGAFTGSRLACSRDGGPHQTSHSFQRTPHSSAWGESTAMHFLRIQKKKQLCVKVCTKTCAFSQTYFQSLWERSWVRESCGLFALRLSERKIPNRSLGLVPPPSRFHS